MRLPVRVSQCLGSHLPIKLALLVLAVLYAYLAWLSWDEFAITPQIWMGVSSLISGVIAYTGFAYCNETRDDRRLQQWVFLGSVVFHLIALIGQPFLEDDFYRYIWDGYVFFTEGTPYGVAPEAFFERADLPTAFEDVLSGVNYPWVPTIYGPVLEYLFLINYLAFFDSLIGLKLVYAVVNLALIYGLLKRFNTRFVLFYAWNPLVLKEFVFTAHPDGLVGAFILITFLFFQRRHYYWFAGLLAMSVATKIVALVFLPFLVFFTRPKHWLVFMSVLLAIYLPFLVNAKTDGAGLLVFASQWQFNASIFEVLVFLFPPLVARVVAGLLLASVILVICYFYYKNCRQLPKQPRVLPMPRVDVILMTVLLLSPVFNPWYLLWLLPVTVVMPTYVIWVATLVAPLSYFTGYHFNPGGEQGFAVLLPAWAIEYVIIYGVVFWRCYRFVINRLR